MIYTIIIANKQVNLKLIKTLRSIFIQKNLNETEVIIVNKDIKYNLDYLKNIFPKIKFKIINEIDKNISDAFNKGLSISKNEFILFMGSGDTFYDDNVLSDIRKYTNDPKIDMIIGKVKIFNRNKYSYSKKFINKFSLISRLSIPHQALFLRRRYFTRFGNFDNKLTYAMDYDLILRSFNKFQKYKSIDRVICNWSLDGIGKNKTQKILDEYNYIREKNNILSPYLRKLILMYSKMKFNIKTFLRV